MVEESYMSCIITKHGSVIRPKPASVQEEKGPRDWAPSGPTISRTLASPRALFFSFYLRSAFLLSLMHNWEPEL
jgi:hypothetical protein